MTDAERIAELEAALARYEALPKLDHPDTQTLADFKVEVERLGTLGTAMALYEQLCSATRLVAQLRRLQDELESQRARNAALESKFNTTELCLKHADGWIDELRARHAALAEQNGNLQSIANQHLANGCRLTEERDQARARHAALVEQLAEAEQMLKQCTDPRLQGPLAKEARAYYRKHHGVEWLSDES